MSCKIVRPLISFGLDDPSYAEFAAGSYTQVMPNQFLRHEQGVASKKRPSQAY